MGKSHLAPLTMLPPKPGVCQECAVDHPEEWPHNRQSLCYQYYFYNIHGRWPTWTDAMAHCDDEMKENWSKALMERGAKLE
jgi:hypothetical protein